MAVRRLNHAVLYVHGLQRTVDFYRAALGFEVRLEIPGRAAFLRAPGSANDHDLGLFEIGTVPESQDPKSPDQPEHPGLYHLAWEVGTLADLADTREKLVQAGALVGESDHRYPNRCTPRIRAASSSRSCGGCPRRTGRPNWPTAR